MAPVAAPRGRPARRPVPRRDDGDAGLRRRSRCSSGASPPIPAATLPDVNGDRAVARGAAPATSASVYRLTDALTLRARATAAATATRTSRRLLFSGPATVGAIVPNMTVEPEMGNNVDVGVKRARRARRGVGVVLQQHVPRVHLDRDRGDRRRRGRCRRRSTSATSASRASRATSTCRSCIRPGVITFFGNAAFTRGTVLAGDEPADRRVARRHAAGQHLAVQGGRRRPLQRRARPVVGRVRRPHPGGGHRASRRRCSTRRT